jgi:phosphate:Na+ symporter
MSQIQTDYETRLNNIYKLSAKNTLEELDVSTLLNISREVYSSGKALISSLKDYLLDATRAEDFENIPMSVVK